MSDPGISGALSYDAPGLIEQRKGRTHALEGRIKDLDSKVSEYKAYSLERGSGLEEEVKKLEERLGTCKVERDVLEERKQRELELFKNSKTGDLLSEKETRKESHKQLAKLIEEKSQILRAELLTEKESREESGDYGIHQVRQELMRLTDRVDQEIAKIEQQEVNVTRKLHDESVRLEALIQNEKSKREKMQNTMLQILEDLSAKHQHAIRSEKKERESTEHLLVKLLENALGSIETGFR